MPALVNAASLFGRIQQFANRLYAPIFITGLNFWAQGFGNYWGHNAIIRTEPFMQYCDLPQLPGRKPFGGQILSHDFVEAALLLKENWEVWLAYDLEGSYEEAPQTMIENAQRDRRWCQGNLQHGHGGVRERPARLQPAASGPGHSRLSGRPVVVVFLLTFNWMLWYEQSHRPVGITVRPSPRSFDSRHRSTPSLIFVICMAVLFLPKVLALVDLALDTERRRAFGGLRNADRGRGRGNRFFHPARALANAVALPVCRRHLLGVGVSWGPQKRAADGTAWSEAARRHWGHTLDRVGLGRGRSGGWTIATFWWFTPVMAGMVLSIPLSVLTSRAASARGRRHGIFLDARRNGAAGGIGRVPRQHEGPMNSPKIPIPAVRMRGWRRRPPTRTSTPFTSRCCARNNSIRFTPSNLPRWVWAPRGSVTLGEKLLAGGPDQLTPAERSLVMTDSQRPWFGCIIPACLRPR